VLLILALAFALTSGGEAPPATGAAALVPADALMYVHLSTDSGRPAVRRARALLARLPDRGSSLTALGQRVVAVVGGSPSTDFGRDIRPWIGREAAFALLNTTGASAGSEIIVGVGNRRRAAAFIARAGAQPMGRYRGDLLYQYPTGAQLAFVGRYLVVGQDASVRAAIDADQGHAPALNGNSTYEQAADDEPAGRVLDAYISSVGVQRVLAARGGFFGELGTLISQPALLGAAVSVSPQRKGASVYVHSALDAGVASTDRTRLAPFTPTLQNILPSGSTLMFDARNLSAFGPTILNDISHIGLLSALPDLLHRLGQALTASGFDIHGVLSLFSGETAIALAHGSGAPAPVIVTRTKDEAAAQLKLASLEAPLAQIFNPGAAAAGITPEVSDVPVAGVTAHQLSLGPGVQLDYAVFRGLIVVSTSLRGIGDVAARSRALGDDASFKAALANRPSPVTSLGFATLSQLLTLGEQTTLSQGAGYRDLQPDLERIRAVGMASTRAGTDTTATLFLQIP
jgi:hypothetical protein